MISASPVVAASVTADAGSDISVSFYAGFLLAYLFRLKHHDCGPGAVTMSGDR